MSMRRANLSRFALFKTTKDSSSTLISHEWESFSKRPEIINVLPLNSKILGGLLLRFYFVQYITIISCNIIHVLAINSLSHIGTIPRF